MKIKESKEKTEKFLPTIFLLLITSILTGCLGSNDSLQNVAAGSQTSGQNLPSPHIIIENPADQSEVFGTIEVKANLIQSNFEDFGFVNLKIDKVDAGTLKTPPFQFVINTRFLNSGLHQITLSVNSSSGEIIETHDLSIRVRNYSNPTFTPDQNNSKPFFSLNITEAGALLFIEDQGFGNQLKISQSGNSILINLNGNLKTFEGPFSQIIVKAGQGNALINIDSSVFANTTLYGGIGNDDLSSFAEGQNQIIALQSNSQTTLSGNSTRTHYWINGNNQNIKMLNIDNISNNNQIHLIHSFYQPWTQDPSQPDYITLDLPSDHLKEPIDIGETHSSSSSSEPSMGPLMGEGPQITDVNQGLVGDCYFMAAIASLAHQYEIGMIQMSLGNTPTNPLFNRLYDLVVDLGDGTYAVQYKQNGAPLYVRVDGAFSTSYAHPGSSGDLWALVMEKSYAYIHTGANSYASLNGGWMGTSWSELGIDNSTEWIGEISADKLYEKVSKALEENRGVTLGTNGDITSGTPLIGGHAYSLIGASKDISGNYSYVLRNPWGFDGVNSDSNPQDGLVKVTYPQIKENAPWMVMTNN